MKCPYCTETSGSLIVTNSRASDDAVYRARKCLDCGKVIYTKETISDEGRIGINNFMKQRYKGNRENDFKELLTRMKGGTKK